MATNATDKPCTDKPPCGGITAGWKVLDASGAVVYEQAPVGPACASGQPSPDVVAAGDSTTWDSSSWGKTAPGRYRIRWQWLDAVDVESDWFTVLRVKRCCRADQPSSADDLAAFAAALACFL